MIRAISYGGGVQSTAMIVLAIQGRITADVALYSNVGDDSEHPATNDYVRKVMQPWAEERGFPVLELHRTKRDGTTETLMERLTKPGTRSVPIPVRMANGAPGNRSCTKDFKIAVVGRWLREHGATRENPAEVLIGISTDEIQRAGNKRDEGYEHSRYPLLDLGLDRSACAQVIRDAGLPVPPKSACYFCPFHRPDTWAEMRRDEPELFWQSVELERHLNTVRDEISCHTDGVPAIDVTQRWEWDARAWWINDATDERELEEDAVEGDEKWGRWVRLGTCPDCDRRRPLELLAGDLVPPHRKDHVYLTRFGKPLDLAIGEAQPTLFTDPGGPEQCDEGYCWT